MSKISKSVLEKIDKEHVKPIPRWQFVLWHVILWLLFTATIIIGSLATGVVLFALFSVHWELIPKLRGGPIAGFFMVLPYLWFGLVALMIYLAFKIYEKTKKGYRHSPWMIAGLSIAISIVLGSILFAARIAGQFEQGVRQFVPQYKQFQELREKIWHAPEKGILPGKVIEARPDKILIINDLTGAKWNVDIKDAFVPPDLKLEPGTPIVAVGEKTGEKEFDAKTIKPHKDILDRTKKAIRKGRQPLTQPNF